VPVPLIAACAGVASLLWPLSLATPELDARSFLEARWAALDLRRIHSLQVTYLQSASVDGTPESCALVTARYQDPLYYHQVHRLGPVPGQQGAGQWSLAKQWLSCATPSLIESYDGHRWVILSGTHVELRTSHFQAPLGLAATMVYAWGYVDRGGPQHRAQLEALAAGRARLNTNGRERGQVELVSAGHRTLYKPASTPSTARGDGICSEVSLTQRDDHGTMLAHWTCEDWRLQSGIWYPARATREYHEPAAGTRAPCTRREEFVVLHFLVNTDIPADLFRTDIPVGAEVRDYRFDPVIDYAYDPDLTEDQILEMTRQRALELSLEGTR